MQLCVPGAWLSQSLPRRTELALVGKQQEGASAEAMKHESGQ